MSPGEAEIIYVRATARHSYVEWTADVSLIVNGKNQAVMIDHDGKPFPDERAGMTRALVARRQVVTMATLGATLGATAPDGVIRS